MLVRATDGSRLSKSPEDDPLVRRVLHAAECIDVGESRRARHLLDGVLAEAGAEGRAAERLARIFALSLSSRLAGSGHGTGNLYVEAGPRDMLAAFERLYEQTPFIRFGHEVANAAILDAARESRAVHVLDLGVGTGVQWSALLAALASLDDPPSLRVTGVDVPIAGENPAARLHSVAETLARDAEKAGVRFAFDGIAAFAEDLDLSSIAREPGECFVVNAAFALHHLPSAEADAARDRDSVLASIHDLAPDLVTLVEPDLENDALAFLPRVRSGITHYGAVLDALERLLADEPEARRIVEGAFFGREILNIVAGEGAERVERHERRGAWRQRLQSAGFVLVDLERYARKIQEALPSHGPAEILRDDGFLVLAWNDVPLVAASAWTPG